MSDVFANFLMYATIGRDRKKLNPDFIARAEQMMRDGIQFAKAFG